MPPDGCTWVCMGAAGCRGTEGQGNNGGRAPDGIVGHVLECISTTKKMQNVIEDGSGDRVRL